MGRNDAVCTEMLKGQSAVATNILGLINEIVNRCTHLILEEYNLGMPHKLSYPIITQNISFVNVNKHYIALTWLKL